MVKRALGRLMASSEFQLSLAARFTRWMIRMTDGRFYRYSPEFKLMMQVVARPHYAWCMTRSADLARRLGHDRISAIEFGVAGGNGLAFMVEYAKTVKRMTGVDVECYGFDTGTGMPAPEGAADLPYWFAETQYRMDEAKLRRRVPEATLVIGDIRQTVGSFVETHDPAPIGAIFNDTDYWSSTLASFDLYAASATRPQNFLPRQFLYFDDVIGSEMEMYGPFNGQLRAIEEFNVNQSRIVLHLNQNLLPRPEIPYRHQIYYAHILDHPDYNRFVGGDRRQEAIEQALKLR